MIETAPKTPLLGAYTKEESLALCESLREDLVETVSHTGGHLSSNLGVVELTVALHRVFDTREDRLVFDVGHQCYIHKMLTGRQEDMGNLRQWGGIAGFPKPSESVHDAFIAGHASNSVAVAVGMAQGRSLLEEDYKVIALLGDGALSGGLAFEGLTTGGQFKGQLLVILNDNGMSIGKSVGGIARYLSTQRIKPQYLNFKKNYRDVLENSNIGRNIHDFNHNVKQAVKNSLFPCSFFEELGFSYYGPVDGHDVEELTQMLHYAKEQENPVFLHVRTTKGKGYLPAEQCPDAFHGVAPFLGKSGKLPSASGKNFSKVMGNTLLSLAKEEKALCAVTAAMPTGTGLEEFGTQFPERLFDVGIAEGCATCLTAGMVKQGAIAVFAVYSTFLQRTYDMLLHDLALEKLTGIIAVDRAGLVGEDGETHHGVFDVAFLSTIPHLTLYAPSSFAELEDMLRLSLKKAKEQPHSGTIALRYPRGGEGNYKKGYSGLGTEVVSKGEDITLVSYGMNINDLLDCERLLKKENISATVLKINQIKPLDWKPVAESVKETGHLLVAEEVVMQGSVGQKLLCHLMEEGILPKVKLVNLGDDFVTHGNVNKLKEEVGLTSEKLYETCKEVLNHE